MEVVALVFLFCAALWLAAFLFLAIAPATMIAFKLIGVPPASWEQGEKHCRKSVVVGAMFLCLGALFSCGLHAAFSPHIERRPRSGFQMRTSPALAGLFMRGGEVQRMKQMRPLLIRIGQRTLGLSLAVSAGLLLSSGHVDHLHSRVPGVAVDFHPPPRTFVGDFLDSLDHFKILLAILWVLVVVPLVVGHFRRRSAADNSISN